MRECGRNNEIKFITKNQTVTERIFNSMSLPGGILSERPMQVILGFVYYTMLN